MGSSKCDVESVGEIGEIRRKDSFVIFDTCNDSKQETTFSQMCNNGDLVLWNI